MSKLKPVAFPTGKTLVLDVAKVYITAMTADKKFLRLASAYAGVTL